MARVLVAVSSIGYGHVARSRALARLLQNRGHSVEILAPPPTDGYVRAWGAPLAPVSGKLEPISPIVERWYEATGRGLIGLRMALEEQKIAQRNARVVEEALDFDGYDLVLADESWELLESPRFLSSSTTRVYMADFLHYSPTGVSSLAAALAVNRYLKRRLERFHAILHVGLEDPRGEGQKWMILWGPRVGDWAREKGVEWIGPLPALLESEALSREEARLVLSDSLGLGPEDMDRPWLLAALGGTRAGYRELLEILSRSPIGDALVFLATGSLPGNARRRLVGTRLVELPIGQRPLLPRFLRAFDASIAPAGLTTLTTHAALGLPTLAFPLPGHFEQERNARLAPRVLGDCIRPLLGTHRRGFHQDVGNVIEYILGNEWGCRATPEPFKNLEKASDFLERRIG